MFEMFNEQCVDIGDSFGLIDKYNPETEKFIVLDGDTDKFLGEVSLFESRMSFNINYWDNWQKNLLTALIRNYGVAHINVYSTDKDMRDSWHLTIYRHKTLLNTHEHSSNIILTNYVVEFCEEVKGKIFTRVDKKYSGCGIDEEKEFSEWIEEQIGSVSEFNNSEYWNSFSSIVFFDRCFTDEEQVLIDKWWCEKNDGFTKKHSVSTNS